MSLLTISDYDKLLKLNKMVNRDYDNFPKNLLNTLSELFSLKLTACSLIKHDNNGQYQIIDVISNSISPSLIRQYKSSIDKKDLFFERSLSFHDINTSKNYTTSDDIGYDKFLNSEYGRFLAAKGIFYQVVIGNINLRSIIGSNDAPFVTTPILSIYKTGVEGNFTDYELELFDKIGDIFNSASLNYAKRNANYRKLNLLKKNPVFDNIGYAIVSNNNSILEYNELFFKYALLLSNEKSKEDIVQEIIDRINLASRTTSQTKFIKDGLEVQSTIKTIQFKYKFEEIRYLTITPKAPEDTSLPLSRTLMAKYHFTYRETEIMDHLIDGKSNHDIASDLCISLSTVKTHVRNIFSKLEVSKRSDALRKIKTLTNNSE